MPDAGERSILRDRLNRHTNQITSQTNLQRTLVHLQIFVHGSPRMPGPVSTSFDPEWGAGDVAGDISFTIESVECSGAESLWTFGTSQAKKLSGQPQSMQHSQNGNGE